MTEFITTLRLILVSDLFDGAWLEDCRAVGEAFYVIAETPEGKRFRHNHTFAGEGRQARTKAELDGARFLDVIEAARLSGKWAGPLATGHWREIQPCYGSEAYARDWRAYQAADALADGEFEPGSAREASLREMACAP